MDAGDVRVVDDDVVVRPAADQDVVLLDAHGLARERTGGELERRYGDDLRGLLDGHGGAPVFSGRDGIPFGRI